MNVCRLCSGKINLIHIFNDQRIKNLEILRYAIHTATGIKIKATDVVSKMVCRRCCEVSFKLHRYRLNAIANDKMLKEQAGQPYSPPTVNQEKILCIAARLASEQFMQNSGGNGVPQLLNKAIGNSELRTTGSLPSGNLSRTESHVDKIFQKKSASKAVCKHSSICELQKQYENILIPVEAFTSDVSPVVSLDRAEVSNWYSEQAKRIQRRLTNVVIKKIPSDATSSVSSLGIRDLKCTTILPKIEADVVENNAYSLSENTASFNNCFNVATATTARDNLNRNILVPNHDKENDASAINTVSTVFPKSMVSVEKPKKKRGRPPSSSKKQSYINNDDHEVVPKKKTRAARKKERRDVFKKIDLPTQLPSDETQEKTIFTSSLELMPVGTPLTATISLDSRSLTHPRLISDASPLPAFSESHPVDLLLHHPNHHRVMEAEKTSAFVCLVCNKVCESKNRLIDHERIHFTYNVCKKKVNSFKSLKKHQRQSCFIDRVNNSPECQLPTITSTSKVTCRYSDAFKELPTQKQTSVDLNVNKVEIDGSSTTNNLTNTISSGEKHDRIANIVKSNNKRLEEKDIYLLDDSGDKIVSTGISKTSGKANKDNNTFAISFTSVVSKSNDTGKSPSPLTERNMLYSLFNKYRNSFVENGSESDVIPKCNIRRINKNSIMLDNAISEFFKYKVGVHIDYNEGSISAKFQKAPLQSHQVALESWQHSTATDINVPNFRRYSINSSQTNDIPLSNEHLPQGVTVANITIPTVHSKQLIGNKPVPKRGITPNKSLNKYRAIKAKTVKFSTKSARSA